ncbi:MAG: molybdopterin-dependent oxidoreductase [Candidatus Jordarchaeaceae archaeon]
MAGKSEIRVVRTACPAHCGIDCCGILAHVKGDRIVKLEPADFPDPRDKRICLRGLSSLEITYHPDRLKYPMKRVGERGEGKFERISWDEAFTTIANKFREIGEKYGWRAIGWVLGGPGAGTTKFGAYLRLASLTQSTRVSTWGYGDAGLPCGSRVLFGTHLPFTFFLPYLIPPSVPELVVVWGSNPAETQPLFMMRKIMDAKEKGAQLVVIDPRFTVTASKADEYLGIRPGTDAALALGLMHVIFKKGLQKDDFIRKYTVGPFLVRADTGKFLRGKDLGWKEKESYVVWDTVSNSPQIPSAPGIAAAITGTYRLNGLECKPSFQLLKELAEQYPPERVSGITGISAYLIEKLGVRIGSAETVAFVTHMGLARTYHGDISMRALGTVAAVTGNVNTSFGSGHLPAVLNWQPFLHAVPERPSYHRLGILQLYDAVIRGKPWPIKAVWLAFINFVNQCANSGKIIREVIPNLEFIVTVDMFMTPTARYADILLPTCSFLEFSDFLPHPYPYVQLQQKVIEPLYESKSDVDIAAGVAEKLGFAEYFSGGEEALIDLIMQHPSLGGITREKLKQQGAMKLPFIPDTGQKFDITFSTPSGRIEIYAEQLVEFGQALPIYLPPLEAPVEPGKGKYPLAFIQGHSRFRTHSMFANVRSLLEMNPEPVVEINPIDAKKRNIKDNDIVVVFNDRARTILRARVTEGIRPGVINITEGWWIGQFGEGSVNHLTHDVINPVHEFVYEPNMSMNDVAVEVEKLEEAEK